MQLLSWAMMIALAIFTVAFTLCVNTKTGFALVPGDRRVVPIAAVLTGVHLFLAIFVVYTIQTLYEHCF
jgi:hypothetical protein